MKYQIHSSDGSVKCSVDALEYNGKWMGESSVSVDIKSPVPFAFELGDYIDYRGIRYTLNYKPSVIKQSSSGVHGESFVYDKLKFYGPEDELKRLRFLDFVDDDGSASGSNKMTYSQGPRFSFHCESVYTLMERIQVNLNREYSNWTIKTSQTDFEAAHDINIDVDNISVWDACLFFHTKFKTSFVVNQYVVNEGGVEVRKNEIVVGDVMYVNNDVLEYGKGKGLTKIERSRDNDKDIINRLRVYGSEKNLPYRYYSDIYDPWYKFPLNNNLNQFNSRPQVLPVDPNGWVVYPVRYDYSLYFISEEEVKTLEIEVKFLNEKRTLGDRKAYLTKYNLEKAGEFYFRAPNGNEIKLIDTYNIHTANNGKGRFYIIVNVGTEATAEAYFDRYNDCVVTSGLSQTLMLQHSRKDDLDLRFSSVPLAPGAININNLMLPSFLDYIGVYEGKEYILSKKSVTLLYDENFNIKSYWHPQPESEGGILSFVEYAPIYLYDEFGEHLLGNDGKWMVKLNTDPYIEDSESISKYGVREGCVYFDDDNNDSETPEIYPTIENEDNTVAIGTNDDKYKIEDDGIPPVKEEGYLKGDFYIEIPDYGFDIKNYLSDKRASIKMKTGDCAGREFELVRNNNNPIKVGNNYQLYLIRTFDESLGRYFPYNEAEIKDGDEFVLLNINLPRTYVNNASEKLQDAAIEYLSKYSVCTHIVIPTLDNIKLARDYANNGTDSVYYKLREGCILRFKDEDTELNVETDDTRMYVDTVTIRETSSEIPKVELKLAKEKEFSFIEKLRSDIRILQKEVSVSVTKDEVKDISEEIIEDVGNKNYISKNYDDSVKGKITFGAGFTTTKKSQARTLSLSEDTDVTALDISEDTIKTGDYESGFTGQGYAISKDNNGDSILEVDRLYVRKKMSVRELEIQEVKHIGGANLLTAASCKAFAVEEHEKFYRVFFLKEDGQGNKITNKWEVGDQAYMTTFNLETDSEGNIGNRYYWRVVTGLGEDGIHHYIDLSNEELITAETFGGVSDKRGYDGGSSIPMEGDNIVQLGNRLGLEGRTSAIELAGAGTDSPYIRQYEDITSFTLGDVDTQIKPGANKFKGKLEVTDGSSGIGAFSDLPDEVNAAVKVGGENLLRNTGFDGDYASQKMEEFGELSGEELVYGERLEFWTQNIKKNVVSVEWAKAVSGYACRFTNAGDSIYQELAMIENENYVLSFKSEGVVNVVDNNISGSCKLNLIGTGSTQRIKFTAVDAGATIWDVKLERGRVQTDWCPAREDNDKMAGEFKDLWYLQHAFKGKTEILGGLILSSLIQLGMYRNGKMEGVTAGISGILEDQNTDVAFWGGGTLQQAMNAVNAYKNDAEHQPTEDELADMAKAVITHGGRAILNDIVLRGYIYALGGVFKGRLEAKEGYFLGCTRSIMTDITPENVSKYAKSGDGSENNPYDFDFDEVGVCIRFSGSLGRVYMKLPFMNATIPASQAERDKIRTMNFSRITVYNNTTDHISLNTGYSSLVVPQMGWVELNGKLIYDYDNDIGERLIWTYIYYDPEADGPLTG